jgi:actin-related protein
VDHPVLLTHPPLGPPSNKAALAELLFEAYGVPSVQFAAPGPCAFLHNSRQGRWV